jgi:hypothetical protein
MEDVIIKKKRLGMKRNTQNVMVPEPSVTEHADLSQRKKA